MSTAKKSALQAISSLPDDAEPPADLEFVDGLLVYTGPLGGMPEDPVAAAWEERARYHIDEMIGMDIVREFKRRAQQALPGRVAKVVLFGSRARGSAAEDSDWDVAVFLVGAPGADERWILGSTAADLLLENGALIQPVALPLERAEEDSQFLRNIRQEGVPV